MREQTELKRTHTTKNAEHSSSIIGEDGVFAMRVLFAGCVRIEYKRGCLVVLRNFFQVIEAHCWN